MPTNRPASLIKLPFNTSLLKSKPLQYLSLSDSLVSFSHSLSLSRRFEYNGFANPRYRPGKFELAIEGGIRAYSEPRPQLLMVSSGGCTGLCSPSTWVAGPAPPTIHGVAELTGARCPLPAARCPPQDLFLLFNLPACPACLQPAWSGMPRLATTRRPASGTSPSFRSVPAEGWKPCCCGWKHDTSAWLHDALSSQPRHASGCQAASQLVRKAQQGCSATVDPAP